jgi:hypothetical protein
MDWDSLKKKSEQKQEKFNNIAELKKRWEELDVECTRKYLEFDVETEGAKNLLNEKAVQGFKSFFEQKEFGISENNSRIEAIYNDIKFEFRLSEGHSYSIHFYIGSNYQDCRVFSVQIAKDYGEKYKQLMVDEIKADSSMDIALRQVLNLEKNKKTIEALLAEKDTVRFMYELDSNYSGIDGQFDSIEEIIETFESKLNAND